MNNYMLKLMRDIDESKKWNCEYHFEIDSADALISAIVRHINTHDSFAVNDISVITGYHLDVSSANLLNYLSKGWKTMDKCVVLEEHVCGGKSMWREKCDLGRVTIQNYGFKEGQLANISMQFNTNNNEVLVL